MEKLTQPPFVELLADPDKRNWTEDFSHENGNYVNKCQYGDHYFLGHKRRTYCKRCITERLEQPKV